MIVIAVRWVLALALLYGVYTETGPWTTLAFTLVFIASEVIVLLLPSGRRR